MPRFTWPDGKKVAAALTFDVDGETIPLVQDPDQGHQRLTLISTATYGPAVGVPRILDSLKKYNLHASFFVPGFTAELHPDMIERFLGEGHEVGHHGYLHERPDRLSDQEEESVLAHGIRVLERLTGRKPAGYRSPSWELKLTTPDLLKRHGFRYDSSLMGDDIPYLVNTLSGTLLELPVQWILDDYPHYATSVGISSPEKVFEVWSSEFAGLHRYNGAFILTMHPFISGRPSRVLLLERMIEYINTFEGVWWATLEQIADHCATRTDLQTWSPPDLKALINRHA